MSRRIYAYTAFIALFALPAILNSQTLTFHTIDDRSGAPLSCFAIVKGTRVNAEANSFGVVRLDAQQNDTIIVFLPGYEIVKRTARDILAGGSIVRLRPKSINLEEVTVRTQRADTFSKADNSVALGFEFYDDFLLSLVDHGRRRLSLELLDLNGRKRCERLAPSGTEYLFRDCFDNVHAVTNDSIYQIYYDYEKLVMLKPYHLSEFYNTLKRCACRYGNRVVYKHSEYQSLKNVYTLFDGVSPKGRVIAIAADSTAIRGFNQDFDLNYFLGERRKGQGYGTSVNELQKNLDSLRMQLELSPTYRKLLQPVSSQLGRTDSAFVLIDFTNRGVLSFNWNGRLLRKQILPPLPFRAGSFSVDPDTRAFVFAESSEVLTLVRYDPISNRLTKRATIAEYPYMSNIRIKNNSVYFLARNNRQDGQKKIIRHDISWSSFGN